MILCDAGVLLCLVDRTQPQHKAYRNTVMRLAKPRAASGWLANAKTTGTTSFR